MEKFILALDQGTTSSRAVIFNQKVQKVVSAQREFPQIYPNAGWVEHNPEDIFASQLSVLKEAVLKANLAPEQIQALGITNQRETIIIWDKKTGKPIYNAIVWQCRRTAKIVDVESITIKPTIAITSNIIIVSITTPVSLMKLLSNILLKNVACTSTPG